MVEYIKILVKASFFVPFVVFYSCERVSPSPAQNDDPDLIFLFFDIRDKDGYQYYSAQELDSVHLWYFPEDGSKGGPVFLNLTYRDNKNYLGPAFVARLANGAGEWTFGQIKEKILKTNVKLYFNNGDIDSIYSEVECHENCYPENQTLKLWYNGILIWDFDFRSQDADLLDRLKKNNLIPFGKDTVFLSIVKYE